MSINRHTYINKSLQHQGYNGFSLFFILFCTILFWPKNAIQVFADLANSGIDNFDELQTTITATTATATATTTTIINGHGYANNNRCSKQKYVNMLNAIDDVEDLDLDVPVHIAFENRQRKRFLLRLNFSTPLTIQFSQNVARRVFFNETTNLLRSPGLDDRHMDAMLLLPCALQGQYDIFVQARQRSSIKLEAHAAHPQQNWSFFNRTQRLNVRHQNRVRKRQMIVKWERSKFDFHAMHYCLIVNTLKPQLNFCESLNQYVLQQTQKNPSAATCTANAIMENIWSRSPERARKIDSHHINIICTGNRTQLLLRGLTPNTSYILDIFGVHTKRRNLTIHLTTTTVRFSRMHPINLPQNTLNYVKISGLYGLQIFSYKIPALEQVVPQSLRYLILPCGGSELNAKILRQRRVLDHMSGIYRPTNVRLTGAKSGERYLMRFDPSNADEKLRANKVGLAVTTAAVFPNFPELPDNITVYDVRTRCNSATIAWHRSPDLRAINYCIIVFNLPQRNRSSIDYTNYCMDFGKRIMLHSQFYFMKCSEKFKSGPHMETETISNLTPGESYLIYVTANLNHAEAKPLPYQSLKVHMGKQCHSEFNEYKDQLAFY